MAQAVIDRDTNRPTLREAPQPSDNPRKSTMVLRLCRNRKLTVDTYRVALYCLGKFSFKEPEHIAQRTIADYLRMQQPNVSRALHVLVAAGFLEEGPPIGSCKTYRLDRRYGLTNAELRLLPAKNKTSANTRPHPGT